MGRLSTHVLDTVRGRPAPGVTIELDRLTPEGGWQRLAEVVTNADGRTDQPLLSGETFAAGTYLLTFHIGAYFKATAATAADAPFLDLVPLRFTVADAAAHYHVPLLATPWSYSTYRGS